MSENTPKRPVTIRDVAERAGVSISTVSHAFSGGRPISPATKERITQAASELGYDPNPSARSLRLGHSGIVGLFLRPRYAVVGTPDRAETFNRLVGAVATEMLRRKIGLIHVPDINDPSVARVPMDGCIVAHPYGKDSVLTELLRRDIPVVTVEEDPDRPDFTWTVRLDYATTVTSLFDHLRDEGAADLMLLTGTEDNAWNRRPQETFVAWCRHHGVSPRTDILSEGLSVEDATVLIRDLLAPADRPDAVVVDTSDFAALVAQVATELGLSVPHDLMIASLTNSEHSRASEPPITAIDLNHESLAGHAVQLMLDRLAGGDEPADAIVVDPVLHLRGSTKRR